MRQQQIPAPENPRLKAALREIEGILNQYDVAGVVILQVPTHAQFIVKVDPSHSLAYMKDRRFFDVHQPIIPAEDDEEGQKAYQQKVADTLNMAVNLQIMCGNVLASLQEATVMIRKTFNLFPPSGRSNNGVDKPKKK